MYPILSSPILSGLGTVFLVLMAGGLVYAFIYLVRYSLRVSRELAQANAMAHRHEIEAVVMSRTLGAEREAAQAKGRLEGLMVHMDTYGSLIGFQAKAEQLEEETVRLRTELRIMQGDRADLLGRYNRAIDRVNESNARANDYRLSAKDSQEAPGRVRRLDGKGPRLVQTDAEMHSGSIQTPNGIVFKGNRKYYLDWEEDGETIGLYHAGRVEPVRQFKLAEIQKGQFNEIAGGIGVLWCANPNCNVLKVTDRRAASGKYCSKECRREHEELMKVSSLTLNAG